MLPVILSFFFHSPKAVWYAEALKDIQCKYKLIKIAVVWSEKWENPDGTWSDLRVNSSPEALDAFRNGISSPYFLSTAPNIHKPDWKGCVVGAFVNAGDTEDSIDLLAIHRFEILTGKKVGVVPVSFFWGSQKFPISAVRRLVADGKIPMIRLMPWGPPYELEKEQAQYSLKRIADGNFDELLLNIARMLRDVKVPFFITFGVEPNGNWFPWSGIFNGGGKRDSTGHLPEGPERYVKAFRHVVEVFRKAGTKNAIWYFQINSESVPDKEWNSAWNYYPGDDYVDWIGFSVYGAQYADEEWRSFDEVFDRIYLYMTRRFPEKPFMICEWGVRETPSGSRK